MYAHYCSSPILYLECWQYIHMHAKQPLYIIYACTVCISMYMCAYITPIIIHVFLCCWQILNQGVFQVLCPRRCHEFKTSMSAKNSKCLNNICILIIAPFLYMLPIPILRFRLFECCILFQPQDRNILIYLLLVKLHKILSNTNTLYTIYILMVPWCCKHQLAIYK